MNVAGTVGMGQELWGWGRNCEDGAGTVGMDRNCGNGAGTVGLEQEQ